MDGDLTWGGEHTTQGTGDVLWNCAPGPCTIQSASVTPINSVKRMRAKKESFKGKY